MLTQSFSKLFWSGRKLIVYRQVCYKHTQNWGLQCLIWRATGSLKDWLTWADPCWGIQCGDKRWETPFLAWNPAPKLKVVVSLRVKHCLPASTIRPSSNFSLSRKEPYQELVVGSPLDPLMDQLGWSLEEVHSQWNWISGSGFLNNSEFLLTCWLVWNVLPLAEWAFKAGLADMPDYICCSSGFEVAFPDCICCSSGFYNCQWVHLFWSHVGEWTVHIDPKQLLLLEVGYIVDNIDPPYWGERHVVFLAILAVARMVIWETWKKGLYDGANFFHCDLIFFLRNQLMKGGNTDPGASRPHPRKVGSFLYPLFSS